MTIKPWNIAVYQYISMISDVSINGQMYLDTKLKLSPRRYHKKNCSWPQKHVTIHECVDSRNQPNRHYPDGFLVYSTLYFQIHIANIVTK